MTGDLRVLITGGAGFIGANLVKRLAQDPDVAEIRVIDDLSSGFTGNLSGLRFKMYEGSILNSDLMDEATSSCTHIVHLAAVPSVPRSIQDPIRSHEANATGTLRVLEAARRHGRPHVALASSSSVYGSNPALPKHEGLRCQPMSPYAVSKLAAEQYALAYAKCYDLQVIPFRFFNVFGPLQSSCHAYAAVIPAFIEAALADRAIPINGDGLQTRDFTLVDTVTEVLQAAIARHVVHGPVNLAFGTRTSLLEVVALLEKDLGRKLAIQFGPGRPGDVAHSQASSDQLRKLFPSVQPIALRDGLHRTVEWFLRDRRPSSAAGE